MTSTPNVFHESIAKLICNHFNFDLPKTGKPDPTRKEWTTLAAIIKSVEDKTSNSTQNEVIAMATGTKCLGKSELSESGDLLSDAHAEVLTRRSFLLYLHDQIDLCMSNIKVKSIFEVEPTAPETESTSPTRKILTVFRLRPGVKFHLFVSHVPCGDAAIFESQIPAKSLVDDTDEPESKRVKLDGGEANRSNRTGAKIHSAEGATEFEKIQEIGKCRIKPGKGDPTLCMSCSDKIAKWQMLGLQGSLLGNFIPEPIRLTSIVIGSGVPFSKTALERAVFGRFQKQLSSNLKYSDLLTQLDVFQTEATNFMNMHIDVQSHPTPASITWSLNQKTKFQPKSVQVSVNGKRQGVTKKSSGTPASRLDICRKNLFLRFVNLLKKCSNVEVRNDWTYKDAKEFNSNYLETWTWLKDNVMMGWTKKPEHFMDFGHLS